MTKKACVNWGEGNRWQVDPIELKKSQQALFSNSIGSNRFEVGELFNLHGMFPLGQHPRDNPSLFGHYRRSQTRRSIVNLYGWRPGQQPRPRIQIIAQHARVVAPQKKCHGGRKDNFSTSSIGEARREPCDRPKIQRKISRLR